MLGLLTTTRRGIVVDLSEELLEFGRRLDGSAGRR
jgi:hypothetical protein